MHQFQEPVDVDGVFWSPGVKLALVLVQGRHSCRASSAGKAGQAGKSGKAGRRRVRTEQVLAPSMQLSKEALEQVLAPSRR